MSGDDPNFDVIHNKDAHRFEVHIGDQLALLEYIPAGTNIVYTHTEVPVELEGQGIAGQLAYTAMEYAKSAGLRVQALCPYVAHYVREHPEYHSMTMGYPR